eukprot:TRINITY_DN24831_c0_g1_i1.p1 TRINITY_DN24831_c0_g1~~TRINITY_DN24831_c0_g1_i1.p1  ORF type:complete len:227 (+),score=52.73 TRINITY_DN24831_c0_g1_i1:120-800(+)
MACCLQGFRRLLSGDDGGDCGDDVPEIFRARYSMPPRNLRVPPLLERAVAEHGSADAAAAALDPARLFVRSRRRFPRHFLHGTLTNSGALGRAVYYFQVDAQGTVVAAFVAWHLSADLEGPPTFCHGGCLAALVDDAFGAFTNTHLRSAGRSGEAVTAFLHVDYKAPTPLNGQVVCVVTLDRVEGRKVFTKCRTLVQKEEMGPLVTTCEANALFVELKQGFNGYSR